MGLTSRRALASAAALLALAASAGCVTPDASSRASPPTVTQVRTATGATESRLPCNRGASPVCDLRIYQVMVGSFVDGDPAVGVRDAWGPGPHRGDIRGVILALDHIKAAGFNTLWITPVFDSRAGEPQQRADGGSRVDLKLDGTGYFARDFFAVDPQFGTMQDLEQLAREARARGIGLVLDGVLGHHKGAVTPSPSGLVPVDSIRAQDYPDGQIAGYPGAVTDWRAPQTRAFFREMLLGWTQRLGLTGWRLDQAYQVPPDGWAELEPLVVDAARAGGGVGLMVGEVWGSAEEMRRTFGTDAAPGLSTLFDFPTRYGLVQAIAADESGKRGPASAITADWAMGAHASYPGFAIPALMIGNHDLLRLGDLIERAGLGGPDTAGYWARHRLAFLFLAAWSGPVALYAGEELGQELGGFAEPVRQGCGALNRCDDHVARAPTLIPGVNAQPGEVRAEALALKADLARWMNLRDRIPALARGARRHIASDATLYMDLKTAPGSCALLALNTGDTARQVEVAATALGIAPRQAAIVAGIGTAELSSNGLALSLPPLGGAIIELGCTT